MPEIESSVGEEFLGELGRETDRLAHRQGNDGGRNFDIVTNSLGKKRGSRLDKLCLDVTPQL